MRRTKAKRSSSVYWAHNLHGGRNLALLGWVDNEAQIVLRNVHGA